MHRIFTSRRLIRWCISLYLLWASSQVYACARPHREHMKNVHSVCGYKLAVLPTLCTNDTNKCQESLDWCHRMAKCWQSVGKVLAKFNMQLRDGSKYQLEVSKLSAKNGHSEEMPSATPVIWYFVIHCLKSLSSFKWHKSNLKWHKYEMCYISYLLELLEFLAWV